MNSEKEAYQVSIISIILNLILSIFKLIAGIIGHSEAMVSDAIHSASDVFSSIVVIIGIKLSNKESDENHPYGHERLECIAANILSMILAITGFTIGKHGLEHLIHPNDSIPTFIPLIAAMISIISKEGMYQYTKYYAKKMNSSALLADAWHHRSDALSSVGALVGILGARNGYPILDSIASLVICICILKAAYDIFMDATNKLVDHSCDESFEQELKDYILKRKDIIAIDLLKTRLFGSKIYVDLEIAVDKYLTLEQAHQIAKEVHDCLEKNYPDIKHCMVHVNPK